MFAKYMHVLGGAESAGVYQIEQENFVNGQEMQFKNKIHKWWQEKGLNHPRYISHTDERLADYYIVYDHPAAKYRYAYGGCHSPYQLVQRL